MKTLIKTLLLCCMVTMLSCQKQQYCAKCREKNTGFEATDFCGSEEQVDAYIQELYDYSVITNQNWICTKTVE